MSLDVKYSGAQLVMHLKARTAKQNKVDAWLVASASLLAKELCDRIF